MTSLDKLAEEASDLIRMREQAGFKGGRIWETYPGLIAVAKAAVLGHELDGPDCGLCQALAALEAKLETV